MKFLLFLNYLSKDLIISVYLFLHKFSRNCFGDLYIHIYITRYYSTLHYQCWHDRKRSDMINHGSKLLNIRQVRIDKYKKFGEINKNFELNRLSSVS